MSHDELEQQLDAYLDGELAAGVARELEAHLRECGDCARLRDARVALSAAIRREVPALRAPDSLRGRIRRAVRAARGTPGSGRLVLPATWRGLAVAASLAVVAAGSWRLAQSRATAAALGDQVLASHVRALMPEPGHLTDVVSSDQHTVKPWFNGKLDYSPPVYDFSGRGFPLLGGRLDYVSGRAVAALVYGRRQHVISVLLWPADRGPSAGDGTSTRQGYHLLHGTSRDYAYWVVSDLGLAELREFAALLQRGDSAAAPRD
jgi:anti-sigma factor (TIGR02949 family)